MCHTQNILVYWINVEREYSMVGRDLAMVLRLHITLVVPNKILKVQLRHRVSEIECRLQLCHFGFVAAAKTSRKSSECRGHRLLQAANANEFVGVSCPLAHLLHRCLAFAGRGSTSYSSAFHPGCKVVPYTLVYPTALSSHHWPCLISAAIHDW
jgi:hypothetical protein